MEILYNKKKFIGAIDFYDQTKGFGFIAMNDKTLGSSSFYINESSFAEQFQFYNHAVVVFQIGLQKSGKTKAVNVRNVTEDAEDAKLALQYYPDFKVVHFKNDDSVDIFKNAFFDRSILVEHVASLIESDENRSPQTVLVHVSTLIYSYATNYDYQKAITFGERPVVAAYLMKNHEYIYDWDFDKGLAEPWIKLLSVLTTPECLEILDKFQSICKLVKNEEALKLWFEKMFEKDQAFHNLEKYNSYIPYLPESIQLHVRTRIDEIVTSQVMEILKKYSANNNLQENSLNYELEKYKRVSPKAFEEEKKECISVRRKNWFNSCQKSFVSNPSYYNSLDDFVKAARMMDEGDGTYLKLAGDTIKKVVEDCIKEKKADAVSSICKRLQQDEELSKLVGVQDLFPLVIDYLGGLTAEMGDSDHLQNMFFESYSVLSSFFDDEKWEQVSRKVVLLLQEGKLVNPIIQCINKANDLFTEDEAFKAVSEIVQEWTMDDVRQFVDHPVSIKGDTRFSEVIYSKIFQCIGAQKIKNDGGDKVSLYQHCQFLKEICEQAQRVNQGQKWDDYIKTRSADELHILYNTDVLDTASEEVAKCIFEAVDMNWICEVGPHWYNPPSLRNNSVVVLCVDKGYDIFSMAAGRLASIDLSDVSNVPLAVYFTELLSQNKPDQYKSDYYEIKNWENNFSKKLWDLKNQNSGNKRLLTILWAVYSQTPASLDGLSELMGYLPPYLQIRCVRKLFQLIASGKIHYTAEGLYNLINSGEKRPCFSLEIVFAYLKLREKDPRATMTNEAMLQLLDNRDDDHRDWIGIRDMMTQCFGRVYVRERDNVRSTWGNDYYNGYVRETPEGLLLYNPNKMIDLGGDDTKYNNKHFRSIDELIRITFKEGEYRAYRAQAGECYVFNKDKEIELYGIAKAYNLKYGHIQDYYPEVNADDEQDFCECRLSDKLDNYYSLPFNWCGNKPCFRAPLRFHVSVEWEDYTVLDFMRILNIPTDYTNAQGKTTKYGHYIILSSYLISFAKFYEHLFCRGCKKLLKPMSVSNFAYKAVTQFSCVNEQCKEYEKIVYLNHCFNTRCKATIDSRDSKTCPNGQYICPDCGACCSTENFRIRMHNLQTTGGEISRRLIEFVNNNNGHWEKDEYYCYKCGGKAEVIEGRLRCQVCHFEKNLSVYKSIRPTL